MADVYNPTPECAVIREVYNKHHCHVPASVWEIPAATVCQVCRLKNHKLFAAAVLQSQEPLPEPVAPINVIQFQKPALAVAETVKTRQLCQWCGRGRIYVKFWNAGRRICCECSEKEKARLSKLETAQRIRSCRICGRTNLPSRFWRKTQGICRSVDCWETFMQEASRSHA